MSERARKSQHDIENVLDSLLTHPFGKCSHAGPATVAFKIYVLKKHEE
jgi:hypothetical protein